MVYQNKLQLKHSTKNKLLVITECEPKKGYGHLIRAMSIANKLKQEGWEVSLFVSNKNMLSINCESYRNKNLVSNFTCKHFKK